MLLPTGTQMQAIDRAAIEGLGIPSLELMERAGQGVADVVVELAAGETGPLVVLCGRGNNGGDGLVAARRLAGSGYRVQVWLAADPEDFSPDARMNWNRLLEAGAEAGGEVTLCPLGSGEVDPGRLAREWSAAAVVVDALLGTGSSGPPRPPVDDWIAAVNACGRPVVAVDVPSGVDADTGAVPGGAVLATVTVTLALPKLGLLLYPGREHAGAIRVVDIGIPPEAEREAGPALELLDNPWAALALPPRPWDGHKGDFGKVVALAGSAGLMGAGRLVAAAAYRAGAGLVRHGAPASLLAVAHAGRDEVMVIPLEDDGSGRLIPVPAEVLAGVYAWADVVALGPGLGTDPRTAAFVAQAMTSSDPRRAMVLDADGLNLIARQPGLRAGWQGPLVITPHPGEAARLLERPVEEITADRVGSARALAARWEAVALLKGAPTVVARPDGRAALCPLGNPGLASGGTGDVLTGVIAGLLAQGVGAFTAAALGAYLHALAGDLAALDLGMWSLMAGDVVGYLPAAFGYLEAWPDRDVLAEGVWT
jgi:hydroxyethylthiazole kinase-like uncharacterized protein yjeF